MFCYDGSGAAALLATFNEFYGYAHGAGLEDVPQPPICSICTEVVVGAATAPCGHAFCGGCIAGWLARGSRTCPNCRGPVRARARPSVGCIVESFVSPVLALLGLSHAAALPTRVAQMPAAAVPTPAVDALVASLMPRLTPEERASVAARAAAAARAR